MYQTTVELVVVASAQANEGRKWDKNAMINSKRRAMLREQVYMGQNIDGSGGSCCIYPMVFTGNSLDLYGPQRLSLRCGGQDTDGAVCLTDPKWRAVSVAGSMVWTL